MKDVSGGQASADLDERATASTDGAIEIRRRHAPWVDRLRKYKVFIDDDRVGAVRNGGSATFPVAPGSHRVELRVDWARSESRPVAVAPGETVTLECRGPNPFALPYWITFGRNRYIQLEVVSP